MAFNRVQVIHLSDSELNSTLLLQGEIAVSTTNGEVRVGEAGEYLPPEA